MKKAPGENVAYDKAYAFAVNVVKCVQNLTAKKKEAILSKQLIRSGTSIGANLSEANGAISKALFLEKRDGVLYFIGADSRALIVLIEKDHFHKTVC